MTLISKDIHNQISQVGNAKKARWLENYVKHDIQSKGVGIPEIRKIIQQANKEHRISELAIDQQKAILNDLMSQVYTEDKLAGILFLQLFWKGKREKDILDLVQTWLDKRWISDWNVCDWMCVRILTPILSANPNLTLPYLEKWNYDSYLWTARCSLVPFAALKEVMFFKEDIKKLATVLIQREERFCKTAVGWVLRVISKQDQEYVRSFINENKIWLTKEVIGNACKYIDEK